MAVLLVACASQESFVPVSRSPTRADPFVVPPLTGYPLTAASDLTERLGRAYDSLVEGVDLADVSEVTEELLAVDPSFHPAQVLRSQVDYLRREDSEVVRSLQPIVSEWPEYSAAQLLLGASAERSGDLPLALEALSSVQDEMPVAARRVAEIRPRAIEIVFNRLQDEIGRGRVEIGEEHLAWLEEWGQESRALLEGGRLVAVEKGDLETELEKVRLLAAETDDLVYLRREAELELEVGSVRTGLDKLESLTLENPEDLDLTELLKLAKFLWRLELLPADVQEIGRKGELDRSDFATLLYWLVPQIRSSQISNPPIAADILDHPRRDVILRVLNLDLMAVDETLHRFEPAAPATRVSVLRALLRVLNASPRRIGCAQGTEALAIDRAWRSVCQQASRCRLITEDADCRPAAGISGAETLDLFHDTLNLLGSGE